MTPTDQKSTCSSTRPSSKRSGDMYADVPQLLVVSGFDLSSAFAMPKSSTTTPPSARVKMCPGLRSACTSRS